MQPRDPCLPWRGEAKDSALLSSRDAGLLAEGCLFTLLIVSFDVQKLLRLIRFHLFIFAFISNILGGVIVTGVSIPLLCLEGVPGLPGAPQLTHWKRP